MSDTVFPRPRGEIGNALSFDFPVRNKTVWVTVDDRLQDVVADGFDAGRRLRGCGSGQECRAGRSAVAAPRDGDARRLGAPVLPRPARDLRDHS
ncbi:hypothetical protein [Salipiger thiooxidans]